MANRIAAKRKTSQNATRKRKREMHRIRESAAVRFTKASQESVGSDNIQARLGGISLPTAAYLVHCQSSIVGSRNLWQ